jgi:hypothetical protein
VHHAEGVPEEFREDVIRVYRDSDTSMAQVAKDFGISPSCLKRWLSIDERNSSRLSLSPVRAADPNGLLLSTGVERFGRAQDPWRGGRDAASSAICRATCGLSLATDSPRRSPSVASTDVSASMR